MNDEEDVLDVPESQEEAQVARGPRVVVAVDCSESARAAFVFALQDAVRRGVPLEVVSVYQPPEYWMHDNAVGEHELRQTHERLRRQTEHRVRSFVEGITAELPPPLPEIHLRPVMGYPADALVREADGADLLVLGSRGHGGLHTALLGSTSMHVAMHATCPVTIVHSPASHRHRLWLHRKRSAGLRDRPEPARAR